MARVLVVLDVDSTLIDDEVIELLAEEAGSLELVADITSRAMNGELDFTQSLHSRVRTLAGLPLTAFDTVRERVSITTGVSEMIAGIHAAGGRVGVVSGGFGEIVQHLAHDLKLDYWRANHLEVSGQTLSGGLTGPIIDAEAKAVALTEWAAHCGVPLSRTVAIGDGANDLRMMAIAGLSVAFDAKAPVRAQADVAMSGRDLSQVLALLGLRG